MSAAASSSWFASAADRPTSEDRCAAAAADAAAASTLRLMDVQYSRDIVYVAYSLNRKPSVSTLRPRSVAPEETRDELQHRHWKPRPPPARRPLGPVPEQVGDEPDPPQGRV